MNTDIYIPTNFKRIPCIVFRDEFVCFFADIFNFGHKNLYLMLKCANEDMTSCNLSLFLSVEVEFLLWQLCDFSSL